MKSNSPWPQPDPFPPTPQQTWTPDDRRFLAQLIHWRLELGIGCDDISQQDVITLTQKLATPKAVRRFHRVGDYEQETFGRKITYIDWLDRVLSGYCSFSKMLDLRETSPEGERHRITKILDGIISQSYYKQYKRYVTAEHRQELVAQLLFAVAENYFYDTEIEPWLWKTARNIILSDGRKPASAVDEHELDIERVSTALWSNTGSDWLALQILSEGILDAIRKIPNRRYRVVLLLIYLYDLDNIELAAFFGVTVSQITTWKSRARKALRKHYTSSP